MRSLAVALVFVLLPAAAHAEPPADPTVASQTPPPESFSAVRWGDKAGYWYSADQVVRIQARIDYLEKQAAKDCVDAQIGTQAARIPGWAWVTVGIVVGGAAGYFGARGLNK